MARSILSFGMFSARARLHGQPQPRIHGRIGRAGLGGGGDFARQLGKQLGAHRILLALAVHDVLELRMAAMLSALVRR
jgi:hypothetical protein